MIREPPVLTFCLNLNNIILLILKKRQTEDITMERFKTLKDHVYDFIAEEIREGKLLPGQRISENDICTELELSLIHI